MPVRPTHDEVHKLMDQYLDPHDSGVTRKDGLHRVLEAKYRYDDPGEAIAYFEGPLGIPLTSTPEPFTAWDTIITLDEDDFEINLVEGWLRFNYDMRFRFSVQKTFEGASNDGLFIHPVMNYGTPELVDLPYYDYTVGEGSGTPVSADVGGKFNAVAGDKLYILVSDYRQSATLTFSHCIIDVEYIRR